MRSFKGLPLFAAGLYSVALGHSLLNANIETGATLPTTAIAERGLLSSIGVTTACSTVSGLASPVPSGSVCGLNATSIALNGAGTIISYGTGSAYITSLAACSAQCLATSCCTNIYFEKGTYCNLHYGPKAYQGNPASSFRYYDASCFTCGSLSCSTTSALTTAISVKSSSSLIQSTSTPISLTPGSASSTSISSSSAGPGPTSCQYLSAASPAPSGAVCGILATGVASTGSGLLIAYTTGSPYVASISACAAQCLATATCTNIFFTLESVCNLHYGPNSYIPNANGLTFYDVTCFTCAPTPIADNLALTTTFTQPPDCTTGGLTEMALYTSEIWENIINPVPNLTITSCFPSQFYSSVLATTSLPPFSALICPYNWETYNVNDTYIICCPNNFGVIAPNITNTDRPGEGAICTSTVWPSVLMDLSSYDSTAFVTVVPTIAPLNGTLVFANAFDGITATPGSTTAIATSTSTSTSTSPSPTKTSSIFKISSTSSVSPTSKSSSSSSAACKTVSGIASPTPSGAICGILATSKSATGAGTVAAYSSGSPYVASLAACAAQCLATANCSNIYFIVNNTCNLHYGPDAYIPNGNGLSFYERACFTCSK